MPRLQSARIFRPGNRRRRLPAAMVLCLVAAAAPFFAASLQAQTPVSVDPKLTFYTHGDPSPDEQYLLELVNRARANPAAEGQMLATVTDPTILGAYAYFTVNTEQIRSDFAGYQARPPLAFNARLMASSRTQSLDQAANGFQGHDGTDGSHFDGRITAAGYQWAAVGENVYAYVVTPFFGYVGMITDWGVPALDHRVNILNSDASRPVFKETGISCVATTKSGYGPLVMTQDFATPMTDTAILVGVVYDDADGNGFYTQGEGAAGIVVTSPQSSSYTITSASGGYALPLDEINGGTTAQVTFDDNHGHHVTRQVQCGNNVADNVKADLVTTIVNGTFSALNVVPIKNADRATLSKGKVRISRDGASDLSQPLTVHYQVAGSAVAGADYKALRGWTTIPAGSSWAVVKVRPLPEQTPDGNMDTAQTVTITLESVDEDPLMAIGNDEASLSIE